MRGEFDQTAGLQGLSGGTRQPQRLHAVVRADKRPRFALHTVDKMFEFTAIRLRVAL